MSPCEKCKFWNLTCAIQPNATVAGPLIEGLQAGMEAEDCPRASGLRHLIQQVLPLHVNPYISLGEVASRCNNAFLSTEAAKSLLEALIIFDHENRG